MQNKVEAAKPRKMRWHHLYYLLAAFDLVTISFSLYLNHRLMDIHDTSVKVNQEWASRLNQFSDLAQLAGAVNAPGNDVFDSQNVEAESARLREALNHFNAELTVAESNLFSVVAPTQTAALNQDLNLLRGSMKEMVDEAELIFSFFRQSKPEKAGERMATMDRKYAKLNGGFAQLGRHIRDIQAENFQSQQTQSSALHRYEYAIAAAIVLMVLAVTIYGHRMAAVMTALTLEKERYLNELREAHDGLEKKVAERTGELRQEIQRRELAQAEVDAAHIQLVNASRQAGMAEVANGVLHNVGNVLNSVNISSGQLESTLRQSAAGDVGLVAGLLKKHSANLGDYLTRDVKGQQIPAYLGQLAEALEQERRSSLTELDSLTGNIDHIKQIITMQQGIARSGGVKESLSVPELFEQALAINMASLDRHAIEVIREFNELPTILADRHQVLQILVNLISNAKYAMLATDSPVKRLTLRARADATRPEIVILQVADTGMGIKPENLKRLFAQGFTTKKDGHGFGLHSGALAAKQMGGTMEAASDGEGRGATFTIHLPVKQVSEKSNSNEIPAHGLSATCQ
jgi:C4-dicarboxylate-specific signal transduction histidine kinase